MVRKKLGRGRKNRCRFCTKDGCPRPAFVDYKDVQGLKKMCTSQGKMFSRKRSGNCAAFQRACQDAVKRARFMAPCNRPVISIETCTPNSPARALAGPNGITLGNAGG